jgi:hypothetical protein
MPDRRQTTACNIYARVMANSQRKAICALERLLFPNVPKCYSSSATGGFVN